MKRIICEMCGSNDLIKQDGVFVCQHCLTKYTVEEARKLMIDGPIEIKGPVKIDTTKSESSLKELLLTEMKCENYAEAYNTSCRLIEVNSNVWEGWAYKGLALSYISKEKDHQYKESMTYFDKAYEALIKSGSSDSTKTIIKFVSETMATLFDKQCNVFVVDINSKTGNQLSSVYKSLLNDISKLSNRYQASLVDIRNLEDKLFKIYFDNLKVARSINDKLFEKNKRVSKDYDRWSVESILITTQAVSLIDLFIPAIYLEDYYNLLYGLINGQINVEYYSLSTIKGSYTKKTYVDKKTKKTLTDLLKLIDEGKQKVMVKSNKREEEKKL